MSIDTTGGVSPLKARQSSRGGERAGKATATSRRRGGFAKSKGKRGAGGANVGGYNVQTRFTPSRKPVFPSSGGTTTVNNKPYTYDADGNLVMNTDKRSKKSKTTKTGGHWAYRDVTEYGNLEKYKKVWDANENDLQGKYDDLKAFSDAGDEWWKKEAKKANMSVEEFKNTYRTKKTTREKYWVPGPTETTETSSSSETTSVKKK